MSLFNTLSERGFIYQMTHEEQIPLVLDNTKPMTFYLGIDPTADSLHIGHFFALMMFRHLQNAGHRGIIVIGGATALVGDPSGKKDMRKVLTKQQVEANVAEVKNIVSRFIDTDSAIILNNADWICDYNFVDFMRDIGAHFNVNQMLDSSACSNRLKEGGLTFLEMSYMLMQAYDFAHLNAKYDCVMQIGGSDQWGNIVAGTNLVRKLRFSESLSTVELFGLTCPLLMNKEGKKMGKTENGALWIAKEKTSIFDFYQYFYNISDNDVEMLLTVFTHIDVNEIADMCLTDIANAKKIMAYEVTKLVHGVEEADKVIEMAKSLFSNQVSDDVPTFKLEHNTDTISLLELLTLTKLMDSRNEARKMIINNGISIDNVKITDIDHVVALNKDFILIRKGKKTFLKIDIQ